MARSTPRSAATPFFEECWYPDKLLQNRDIGRENASEQLVAEQESFANLFEQVNELKRKTEKTEREFDEFKIQQ